MAKKKSAKYPYQWPDGSWHSIPWGQHRANVNDTAGQIQEIRDRGLDPNPLGVTAPAPTPTTGELGKGLVPLTPGPQPVDAAFEAQKLNAQWNIGTSDAEASYQTGRTAYLTGYNADGSLNTSNPYSQAMLLQDNYKRSQVGTNNSMAAMGQYHSGARLNAQGRNDRLYAEGSAALRDRTQDTYHNIGYGRLMTYGQNSIGTNQAGYDAVRRAVYGS